MSTVKNYDAEGFTDSEIEIKSGQNYDIKFKNAISGQIDWNVSGDNIAVNVYKTKAVHTDAYRSYGYEKTEYGKKALNTEVLEKKEVTVDSDFVTNHSYIKVTKNTDGKYVIQAYEKTRTQNEAGEWSALSGETAVGDPSTPYDTIDDLKGDTTYSSVLGSFKDEQLGAEILVHDTTKSVYTTSIYEATTKVGNVWQFGEAVSVVTKTQPTSPVEGSISYATVKYTQAWDANKTAYGDRAEVTNGRTDGVNAETATLLPTEYIYSMTVAKYDFENGDFGKAAAKDDLSTATALEHLTVYTRTSTKNNETTPTTTETEEQYTAFETYLQDNSATTDAIQLALDENSKKVVLGTLTLKNAATFGQDSKTGIGLEVKDSENNPLPGYGNLITNNGLGYEVAGVQGTGSDTIGKFFTGTSLNETATSTAKDDTFNLGTGSNVINIDVTSGFGHDTVIATEGEQLTVNLNGFTSEYAIDSSVSENGKDVILTVKKDEATQGSITIQDYNEKNVFGQNGDITIKKVNGSTSAEYNIFGASESATVKYDSEYVTKATATTMTGTWRDNTATTTALNDTINLGTGNDVITVKALNNGNDTVIANKDETLTLSYDKTGILNTSASNIAKIEVKGSDVVASTEVEYYATMTITKSATKTEGVGENAVTYATMDGQKITGYDFNTPKDGKVEVKFVLAKYGTPNQTMKNKMLWRSENPFYKTDAYPNGVYLFLDNANFASEETAEEFGGILLDNKNLKVYESINGAAGVDVTNTYKTKYSDLATFSTFNEKLLSAATESTVTVQNALKSGANITIDGKVVTASVDAIDTMNEDIKEQLKASNTLFEAEDVVAKSKKGKLDLSKVSNDKVISLASLTSENGKGANIITKAGNDTIVGSDYNDTLNLKTGNNDITESAGVNKITTGKGDDTITINGLASATIKTSGGNNTVSLNGYGVNKFTGGKGTDTVTIAGATNTVKAGKKGVLDVTINGGNNNITGGKKADDIRINNTAQSVNKINAGAGKDYIIAEGGYNTITLGKGNDDIVINNGTNVVKGTAGKNTYTITGGDNVITGGKNVDVFIFSGNSNAFVNGGKGNDIYDLSAYGYGGSVSIKDTSGKNVVKLADEDTILFDVTLGKNAKKDKVGKVFTFDKDGDNTTTGDTVTFNGSIKKVTVGNTDYTLNVKGVAEQVASFMRSAGYGKGDSAYDVLAKGDANATKLLDIYQGDKVTVGEKTFSAQMYQ